ncbi:MAG: hypothetical protein ABIZ64_03870, partial [Casimicrobium sp.]
MNHRSISMVAAGVIAAVTLVALIAQTALLGALGLGGNVADASLLLTPAVNAQTMSKEPTSPIKFDASRGAAVAQARGLNIPARDVLAVKISTVEVTGNIKLALGWLSTQNLSRSATASAPMAASAAPKTSVVLLSGH